MPMFHENEERLVAYHEAGHTLMALLFKEFFDVRKVTINANTNIAITAYVNAKFGVYSICGGTCIDCN